MDKNRVSEKVHVPAKPGKAPQQDPNMKGGERGGEKPKKDEENKEAPIVQRTP